MSISHNFKLYLYQPFCGQRQINNCYALKIDTFFLFHEKKLKNERNLWSHVKMANNGKRTRFRSVQFDSADHEKLKLMLQDGGEISRRQAMSWLGSLGIGTVSAVGLISSTGRALAATPQKGWAYQAGRICAECKRYAGSRQGNLFE